MSIFGQIDEKSKVITFYDEFYTFFQRDSAAYVQETGTGDGREARSTTRSGLAANRHHRLRRGSDGGGFDHRVPIFTK